MFHLCYCVCMIVNKIFYLKKEAIEGSTVKSCVCPVTLILVTLELVALLELQTLSFVSWISADRSL